MAKKAAIVGGPVKAVLYTRVSGDKQAQSKLGLEAQLAKCQAYAAGKGYEVIATETDPAITGKDEMSKRPGLARVVELAKMRPDVVVIVYSLSRLSRRQRLTWALLDEQGDYRLQVESATEPFNTSTPMGRAMLGMLAVWATLEADMCSERTSAALQARRARGFKLGPKSLAEEHPDVVRRVKEMYDDGRGGFSHKTLAEELNRLGVRPMRGERWHATTIARVLAMVVRAAPVAEVASS